MDDVVMLGRLRAKHCFLGSFAALIRACGIIVSRTILLMFESRNRTKALKPVPDELALGECGFSRAARYTSVFCQDIEGLEDPKILSWERLEAMRYLYEGKNMRV